MLQDFMGKLGLLSLSLVTIHLRGEHMEAFNQPNTVKSMTNLIHPLFLCNWLEVVSLTFHFFIYSELEAAALAWPLLEQLILQGSKQEVPKAEECGLTLGHWGV